MKVLVVVGMISIATLSGCRIKDNLNEVKIVKVIDENIYSDVTVRAENPDDIQVVKISKSILVCSYVQDRRNYFDKFEHPQTKFMKLRVQTRDAGIYSHSYFTFHVNETERNIAFLRASEGSLVLEYSYRKGDEIEALCSIGARSVLSNGLVRLKIRLPNNKIFEHNFITEEGGEVQYPMPSAAPAP